MTELDIELLHLIVWVAASGAAALLAAIIWRRILIPISERTRTSFDTMLLESSDGRAQWVILALGLYLGAANAFTGVAAWRYCVAALYVHLVFAVTCLAYSIAEGVVNWYAESFAEKTRSDVDDRAVILFHRFAKLLFFFVALTVIFQHFDIQITGILATAGIASFAFALAAQDTLANLISGVILMFDRPFKRGDRITLPSGGWGDVMEIGLRSTKVLSFEQKVIVIPNAEIAKSEIVNHSVPDQKIKVKHGVGVAYGSDMHKVKAIIQSILSAHPEILNDPPPEVFFTEFGDSSLDLTIFFWLGNYLDRWQVMDDVNMAIKDKFEAEGIEIPFPQRDVYIRAQAAPGSDA
ncbi:MAG: mechanosensitive ion channel family protein [Planctomycetota bacterium]